MTLRNRKKSTKQPTATAHTSPLPSPTPPSKYLYSRKKLSLHQTPPPPPPPPPPLQQKLSPQLRLKLKKTFTSFQFYFDLTGPALENLSRQTITLGATVVPFFSDNVTHLVTTEPIPPTTYSKLDEHATPTDQDDNKENASSGKRKRVMSKTTGKRSATAPPKVDNVSTAVKLGIAVWTVEKFQRILTLLAEPNIMSNAAPAPSDMNGLPVLGTSAEFYPFEHNYILVEDATGLHCPIASREYPSPKDKKIPPWSNVYLGRSDKSPFTQVEESEAKSNIEKTKPNCQKREKKPRGVLGSKTTAKKLSKKPKPSRVDASSPIVDTAISQAASAFVTPPQKSYKKKTRASGHILGGSESSNIKNARCLSEMVTPKPKPKKSKALKAKTVSAEPKANQPLNAQLADATNFVTKRGEKNNDAALIVTKRPGYCENCYEMYDDMDEHIVSDSHREFATDPEPFAELDELLDTVARVPKHYAYTDPEDSCPSYDSLLLDELLDDDLWDGFTGIIRELFFDSSDDSESDEYDSDF